MQIIILAEMFGFVVSDLSDACVINIYFPLRLFLTTVKYYTIEGRQVHKIKHDRPDKKKYIWFDQVKTINLMNHHLVVKLNAVTSWTCY